MKNLIKELRKRGMSFGIVEIKIDPKIKRAVRKYVLGIEEAHKKAAKSKLRFGATVLIN